MADVGSRTLPGRAGHGGVRVRPVRLADVRAVLAIERQAFPDDPWTLDSAGGLLARSRLGRHVRWSARLARLIRFGRLTEAVLCARLACAVLLRRPTARHYLVAYAGGAVSGYGCLNVAAATAEIQAIAVRGDREGLGIGTELLAALIATAADLGCRGVELCVRAGNTRAHGLYLRTGFGVVGRRRRYYQPSGTDAVVMRLPLTVSR